MPINCNNRINYIADIPLCAHFPTNVFIHNPAAQHTCVLVHVSTQGLHLELSTVNHVLTLCAIDMPRVLDAMCPMRPVPRALQSPPHPTEPNSLAAQDSTGFNGLYGEHLPTAFVPVNRPKSPTQPFGVGTTNIHTSAGRGTGFRGHSSQCSSSPTGEAENIAYYLPCLALHSATSHIEPKNTL